MRKYAFLVVILIILAGGGMLSAIQQSGGFERIIPYLQQTSNPEASPAHATVWQAEQLVFFIGFVLVNLIGIGGTIAFVMWALDRQVRVARANSGEQSASAEAEAAE
ncbi:MAG: hypothetical protein CUN52_11100 [Phototrophicales bacterium]|nr:MAG: hypothetical protein CUN52_11100 [Phototrophicales bacterium]